MYSLIDKLRRERRLDATEYTQLLYRADNQLLDYAAREAREVTAQRFGSGIFIRGLVEVTNFCRNDCYYCGLRRSNRAIDRYRLTQDQVMACCDTGYVLGFRTFVLQGGEDGALSDTAVEHMVRAIRKAYPDCAVTLSLGERTPEVYRRLFDAGATRYLLRHETATPSHYTHLHPASMSYKNRMECLRTLREIGYQTGTGIMVGSPGQTIEHIVEDILFIEKFHPQMIGIGPYLPQKDTPFANEPAGSMARTLLLLSIFRLMLPNALIPSTTALASIASDGRERGILAGANVVMPNLSPEDLRAKYAIYDHKKATDMEAAEGLDKLEHQLATIGYHITYGRGDYSDN